MFDMRSYSIFHDGAVHRIQYRWDEPKLVKFVGKLLREINGERPARGRGLTVRNWHKEIVEQEHETEVQLQHQRRLKNLCIVMDKNSLKQDIVTAFDELKDIELASRGWKSDGFRLSAPVRTFEDDLKQLKNISRSFTSYNEIKGVADNLQTLISGLMGAGLKGVEYQPGYNNRWTVKARFQGFVLALAKEDD